MSRALLLAAAAVVCALVLPAGATAASHGTPLVGVTTTTTAGPVKVIQRSGLTTLYCRTVAKRVTGHSYFGIDIWWIRQRVSWCYKITGAGGQAQRAITSITPKCGGATYGITGAGVGWEWKGWVECYGYGGVGSDVAMRGKKGHFAYCPGPCLQNFFPWAKVWVRSDGTYERAGGGAP